MTQPDFQEMAKKFQGLIEWIEEGYPPECDVEKGQEEVISRIASVLQKVYLETKEEDAKIAEDYGQFKDIEPSVRIVTKRIDSIGSVLANMIRNSVKESK